MGLGKQNSDIVLKNSSLLPIALSLAFVLVPLAASAEDPLTDQPTEEDTCRLVDGVLECGSETLDGQIDRPEAFYVLQPTNLTFEHQRPAVSFLPELLRTVTEGPL